MAKDKETQAREELVGLLTAISIVSRRLADNLKKLCAGTHACGKEAAGSAKGKK